MFDVGSLSSMAAEGETFWMKDMFRRRAWFNINQAVILPSDPCGLSDEFGLTALHRAALGGHEDVVDLLLAHGASPTVRSSKGRTPIDIAAAMGYRQIVLKLEACHEKLTNPACTAEEGRNKVLAFRLYDAVKSGKVDAAKDLLEMGADCTLPIVTGDWNPCGYSEMDAHAPAICWAAHYVYLDTGYAMLSLIIEKKGPGVLQAVDSRGLYPIHWLAQSFSNPPRFHRSSHVQYETSFTLMIKSGALVNALVGDTIKSSAYDMMNLNQPREMIQVRMACAMANFGSRDANLTKALHHFVADHRDGWPVGGKPGGSGADLLVKHGADPEVLTSYRVLDYKVLPSGTARCRFERVGPVYHMPEEATLERPLWPNGRSSDYVTRDHLLKVVPELEGRLKANIADGMRKTADDYKRKMLWSQDVYKESAVGSKAAINTVLYCAYRLANNGLHLPPEIWMLILSFWSFVRWPISAQIAIR